MFRKSLIPVVILLSVVSLGDGKAIESKNKKYQTVTINSASRTRDRSPNENFASGSIESERTAGETIDRSTCVGNCNAKDLKGSSGNERSCPYQSKELCLIFSLSKIARVQVAASRKASTDHGSRSNIFDGASKDGRSSRINEEMKRREETGLDVGKRNDEKHFENTSEQRMKSSNVHCRAIRDVYIPEVKQSLPAFGCKFGNSTFVLSSERFLQDRRSYLDVRVDESTFKNMKLTPKTSRINEVNVIPALLVLNLANNGYRIEMRKNLSKE